MKKLITIISLSIAGILSAQTLSTVKRDAPVFPGCEKSSKESMQNCFNDKFEKEINSELKNYRTEFDSLAVNSANAKVKVNINKNGTFGNMNILNSSNKDFSIYLKKSMENVSKKISKIIPAKNEKGEATDIILIIPIKYLKQD